MALNLLNTYKIQKQTRNNTASNIISFTAVNSCLFISSAVSLSMALLVISTPPKADTGSPASASFHASISFSREAKPQALKIAEK